MSWELAVVTMLIKFQNISYDTCDTFINDVKHVHEYFGKPL